MIPNVRIQTPLPLRMTNLMRTFFSSAIRLAPRVAYAWASRSARGARLDHLWSPTTAPPGLSTLGRVRCLSTKSAFDSSHQPEPKLTHVDAEGRPHMVDVSNKESTSRTATAEGRIYLPRVAYELVSPTTRHAPAPLPTSRLGGEKPKHPEKSVVPDRAPDLALETDLGLGAAMSELEKAKSKARKKGDVLIVAQLAAIMACKRTAELIPLCHPLPLSHVSVALTPEVHPDPDAPYDLTDLPDKGDTGRRPHLYSIKCIATVSCDGKTGVEMEALTAVSVGLLTVWDMLKAVAGKEMVIGDILVRGKAGGKSGDFVRRQ